MKSKCFYKCDLYKWNKENLKLSQPMHAHINHHLNNDLTKVIGYVREIRRQLDPELAYPQFDMCVASIMQMAEYITDIGEFIQEEDNNED